MLRESSKTASVIMSGLAAMMGYQSSVERRKRHRQRDERTPEQVARLKALAQNKRERKNEARRRAHSMVRHTPRYRAAVASYRGVDPVVSVDGQPVLPSFFGKGRKHPKAE